MLVTTLLPSRIFIYPEVPRNLKSKKKFRGFALILKESFLNCERNSRLFNSFFPLEK